MSKFVGVCSLLLLAIGSATDCSNEQCATDEAALVQKENLLHIRNALRKEDPAPAEDPLEHIVEREIMDKLFTEIKKEDLAFLVPLIIEDNTVLNKMFARVRASARGPPSKEAAHEWADTYQHMMDANTAYQTGKDLPSFMALKVSLTEGLSRMGKRLAGDLEDGKKAQAEQVEEMDSLVKGKNEMPSIQSQIMDLNFRRARANLANDLWKVFEPNARKMKEALQTYEKDSNNGADHDEKTYGKFYAVLSASSLQILSEVGVWETVGDGKMKETAAYSTVTMPAQANDHIMRQANAARAAGRTEVATKMYDIFKKHFDIANWAMTTFNNGAEMKSRAAKTQIPQGDITTLTDLVNKELTSMTDEMNAEKDRHGTHSEKTMKELNALKPEHRYEDWNDGILSASNARAMFEQARDGADQLAAAKVVIDKSMAKFVRNTLPGTPYVEKNFGRLFGAVSGQLGTQLNYFSTMKEFHAVHAKSKVVELVDRKTTTYESKDTWKLE